MVRACTEYLLSVEISSLPHPAGEGHGQVGDPALFRRIKFCCKRVVQRGRRGRLRLETLVVVSLIPGVDGYHLACFSCFGERRSSCILTSAGISGEQVVVCEREHYET